MYSQFLYFIKLVHQRTCEVLKTKPIRSRKKRCLGTDLEKQINILAYDCVAVVVMPSYDRKQEHLDRAEDKLNIKNR